MFRTSVACWTLALVGGFAFVASGVAYGQQPQLPSKSSTLNAEIIAYRDQARGGISKDELPKAREAFKKFAKYYADVIASPVVYQASRDLKNNPASGLIPTIDDGPNGLFRDLDRFLLDPLPTSRQINQEPADYIREMGAALDAALKPLIETHGERIVRINAARTLAHVARTGAPAHFATVIPLIANANTPTEIKYYMFHAAAGLLNAADMNDPKVRKHAAEPKVIGELVKALQDCITNPAMLLPGFKKETATPEQIRVLGLVRRQAIKALGQVKFVIVPGPDGRTPIYPAYTLVRVAMNDPSLLLASTPADAAEVVLGLCNMAPMQWQGTQTAAVRSYNADVAVEAITQALATFAGQRAANPFDRSLPWRGYSLRIAEALLRWQQLFDPNFDKLQPNKAAANLVPAVVKEMCKEVIPNVLAKIEKVDAMGQPDPTATVKIGDLQMRLDAMRQNPKRKKTLFEGVPETSIEFAPVEK